MNRSAKNNDIKFKCCNKELNNFCCLTCNNIFHKSCCERKKGLIIINKHIIYCSEVCAEKTNTDEEIINELRQQINNMNIELEEKNVYIQNIKRRSKIFEDDAIESEQNYLLEIEEYKIINDKLKAKLDQMLKRNSEIEEDLSNEVNKLAQYEKEINELRKTNYIMQKCMEDLKIKNQKSANELNKQNQKPENSKRQEDSIKNPIRNEKTSSKTPTVIPTMNKTTNCIKTIQTDSHHCKRLLILCDEAGRNINRILMNKLNHNEYHVETIIKPGATFEQIIENMDLLTSTLSTQDQVVIMGGSNNFNVKRRYPLFKAICNKVKQCANHNILIATVPFSSNQKLNKFIHKFNVKLDDFVTKLNNYVPGTISLLNVNDNVKLLNKNDICKQIIRLTTNKNKHKNLIFINTDSNQTVHNILEYSIRQDNSVTVIDETLNVSDTITSETHPHFLDLDVSLMSQK